MTNDEKIGGCGVYLHHQAMQRLDTADKDPAQALTAEQRAEVERNLLRPEQLQALASMKSHTDFNDLATKSELGAEAVERQVKPIVADVIAKHQEQQQRTQQQEAKEQQAEVKQERRAARIG